MRCESIPTQKLAPMRIEYRLLRFGRYFDLLDDFPPATEAASPVVSPP